ncbi:hypothetical protein CRN67_05835 [Campylobacter blaseri]|uniref:Selenoprotein n=1 Tax=Campylobacter blaseri TaxID=2042961 RepID=A0A2P8R0Q4_9BACT|nr:hypothetical protein CQ405_05835 [Campylobacter blaseri]PSM53861.1 hypothetical protein CRN67_05835 [Campylobacter blaseri]
MKEEILKAYPDAVVETATGLNGIFTVDVDDKTIFSKRAMEEPRFPFENEIVDIIKKIS